jgi:hypothetical protein
MPRPKLELFQWSADTVQKELGYKRDTFLRNAIEQNIAPDEHGKYTSRQVFTALTSDTRRRLEQERLLLVQQQRQRIEFENGEAEGRLVNKDDFIQQYSEIFSYIRTTIFASKLSEQEKKDISIELQRVVVEKEEWQAFRERMDALK